MNPPRLIYALLLLLPVSCASDSKETDATSTYQPLSQRLEQTNGYKQDADGNWVPQNNRRSTFESVGRSSYFTGTYGKKAYETKRYDQTPLWAKKEAPRLKYAGNTDGSAFHTASKHNRQMAAQSGMMAAIPDRYPTTTRETEAAREDGFDPVSKPEDAESSIRRKVYPAPFIIDWREHRKLSVEQSRGLLGR